MIDDLEEDLKDHGANDDHGEDSLKAYSGEGDQINAYDEDSFEDNDRQKNS